VVTHAYDSPLINDADRDKALYDRHFKTSGQPVHPAGMKMDHITKTSHPLIEELNGLLDRLRAAGFACKVDVCDGERLSDGIGLSEDTGTLRNILNAAPVGLAHFEQGVLTWANAALLEMFGFGALEDCVAKKPEFLFESKEEFRNRIELLASSLELGKRAETEAGLRRNDGGVFFGVVRISASDPRDIFGNAIISVLDITSRMEVENILKENESMLRSILAASPVGICRVQDREFVWVNDAMLEIFGASSESDFVGKNTGTIYAGEEEYHRVGELLYRSLEQGTESETAAKLKRKDGSVFDGHIRISAPDPTDLRKRTIATFTDMSWIKEAEEAILQSESRYREILENVRLVAVGLDIRANITFCNDFLLELTGMRREQVLGRNWFDVFVPCENRRARGDWYQRLVNGTLTLHHESDIFTRFGERRSIAWNNTILRDHHKNIVGIASIGEDITDRSKTNELLLQTERIKAVGEMAGAVAHNFNNLLQIVLSGAQLAHVHLELGNYHQIKPRLDQIIESSRLGAQTIRRLQEFARIRSHESHHDWQVFDLSNTLRQAAEMSRPLWKTNPELKGITISLALQLEPNCVVRGKENEFFEVAINLMKNAAEALPKGGEIKVRSWAHDSSVMVQVMDDGIGIPEASLSKVFQPFWTTKGLQGTGMGLSSCYGIVTRHGGSISVDSQAGHGTIFTISVPRAAHALREHEPSLEDHLASCLTILLVDDMEPVVSMLESGLSEYGQTVYSATCGRDAIRIFEELPIDVVVCDLGMEGMNGWDVSKAISEICRKRSIPKTPFVLLSGWGWQITEDERITRSGVDKVLTKPVMVPKLLEALRDLVSSSRQTHPCN
jgi:PAS domain S-box-containing protein